MAIKVYLCNGNNPNCKKTGCYINGGECKRTQFSEYAMNPNAPDYVFEKCKWNGKDIWFEKERKN